MANWKRTIKGINENIRAADENLMSNKESMGNIAAILKKDEDYIENDGELFELVDEMEWAVDKQSEPLGMEYYNCLLAAMYDWADVNLVWIELS